MVVMGKRSPDLHRVIQSWGSGHFETMLTFT